MNTIDIVEKYFKVSNKSDLDRIAHFFTDTIEYSSTNTWKYVWADDVMEMQREFHSKFSTLNWTINSIWPEDSDIVCVDYSFEWILKTGEKISSQWLEYVEVEGNKINYIEIKNK